MAKFRLRRKIGGRSGGIDSWRSAPATRMICTISCQESPPPVPVLRGRTRLNFVQQPLLHATRRQFADTLNAFSWTDPSVVETN